MVFLKEKQSYFEKFSKSDLSNKKVRDYVFSYFIDKIYLYDDIIAIISKWGEKYTYRWDEVDSVVDYIYEEFESLAGHSTRLIGNSNFYSFESNKLLTGMLVFL